MTESQFVFSFGLAGLVSGFMVAMGLLFIFLGD